MKSIFSLLIRRAFRVSGLLIIITAIAFTSQAQGTWTQKADFGGTARDAAVGFSIGNEGYVGTGHDGMFRDDFWQYDPGTNVWTQKANFGGGVRAFAVAFAIGTKGYLGTGWDGNTYKNDFWEYDPSTNKWTQKANYGGGNISGPVGFSIGNKGYVGTGEDALGGSLRKDFWEYDPMTDIWAEKTDYGGVATKNATGFSIGSKGYIGTGGHDVTYNREFWEYDPTSDSWTKKADFGETGRYFAVGFSIGNKGYIGTGSYNYMPTNDVWEYDPATNQWLQVANFSGPNRLLAVGFSIGSKGYIGTGFDNVSNYFKDFWEYTPDCYQNITVYADTDGDGYGNANKSKINSTCDLLTGYVLDSTDCNDANAAIHPNTNEIIGDGIDNNCNGLIDEKINNALSFDGVNDYVDVGNTGISSVNTRAFWFKPNNLAGSSNQYFMDFGGNNYWVQLFDVDGDGKLELRAGAGNVTYVDGIEEFTNINKWYYVAVTVNSSRTLTIYVNGNYDNSGSVDFGTPQALVMGRTSGGGLYFNGLIDEVRVWNVARTQAQIQSDMYANLTGNELGLVAYYPFNQGVAGGNNAGVTTLNDITANNNDGTLTNFALNGSKSNWVAGVPGCNGLTVYADADDDGYGNATDNLFVADCIAPVGYVYDNTDCNDKKASIHPGAAEICGNGIDDNCNGKVDDECLSITSVTDINSSQATLQWNAVAHSAYYRLRIYRKGSKRYRYIAVNAPITGTVKRVSNLKPSTNYNAEVMAMFGNGADSSGWSAPFSFMTEGYCNPPTGLTVMTVGNTSARVGWASPVTGISHYKLRIRKATETAWTYKEVSPIKLNTVILGLSPNTVYKWHLKSGCINIKDKSNWAIGPSFTTTSSIAFSINAAPVTGRTAATDVSVRVIPNPGNGNFTVQMQLSKSPALTTLSLYNNTGAKLWQEDAGILSGTVNRNISLQTKLPAGVFVLMIQHGNTRLMQKLVVVK